MEITKNKLIMALDKEEEIDTIFEKLKSNGYNGANILFTKREEGTGSQMWAIYADVSESIYQWLNGYAWAIYDSIK